MCFVWRAVGFLRAQPFAEFRRSIYSPLQDTVRESFSRGPLMKQLSIVLLAFSLSGCPGFGDKTIDELTDGKDITYESHIKAILDARCATCHGETPIAGASNSLHDYATASAQVERIHARSVVELTMPPGAALSPEDRALIDAWYRAGAPEGTPSRDAGVMDDVSMPPDDAMPPLDDGGMTTPTWDDPIVGIMRNS